MNARSPMNPLLDFSGLPRFDAIRPEDVAPAIDELVARARAAAEGVATDARPATWDTVVAPLDDALDGLDRSWSAVNHLNAVVSTPALRDAYHASLPKITALYADLAQDERLYARYKALAAAPSFAQEDAARRKVVANELGQPPAGGGLRLRAVQRELVGDPAVDRLRLHIPDQHVAYSPDRLRDRAVLLQLAADEGKRRPGRGRLEVLGDGLRIRRLPDLDIVEEHQPCTRAEQAERIARRNRVLAGRIGGIMHLDRV